MKGKYISTSVMLAVLAGGKEGTSVLVDETKASTQDHKMIWTKTNGSEKSITTKAEGRDELKAI